MKMLGGRRGDDPQVNRPAEVPRASERQQSSVPKTEFDDIPEDDYPF